MFDCFTSGKEAPCVHSIHFQNNTERNDIFYLEDGAPDIGGAAVSCQLHHQLLQDVHDNCRREELPAPTKDLTDTQDGVGAHSGMRVIKEILRMVLT